MSAPEPAAPPSTTTLEQDPPFIKFPPFPEPPPGVTIMRFKDFKPHGIQLFSEPRVDGAGGEVDDAELDALGIPTVELRVKHATDECKSSPRKKRKKKKNAAGTGAGGAATEAGVVEAVPVVRKRPWYEEWEEGEDLRVTMVRYDLSVSPVDRFLQSAHDFRTGRPWPPVTSGLNNLWDQFRLFTGLLVNPSVFRKAASAGTKKCVRADSPDFESDDDDEGRDPAMDDLGADGAATAAAGDTRPAKRARSGGEGLDADIAGESALFDPHKLDEDVREQEISNFLADPERAIQIFLSSYMREHGLIWTERNLIYTPRLVYFFLAFVLRNRVLLEPMYQRSLKRALETVEWAKKELPLTYKVGQSIPDAFNEACREYFGRQGGINWSFVNATTTTTEQKDASITVTDMSNNVTTDVSLPTEAQMQLKDVIEDNANMEVSIDTASTIVSPINGDALGENIGGWGSGGDNGWGGESGGWDDTASWNDNGWAQDGSGPEAGGEAVANPGSDANCASAGASWNRDPASLLLLLGPTTLPLTHTTGIVECSTRRVAAVYFPAGHPKSAGASLSPCPQEGPLASAAGKGQDWMPSACGVEAELDARFAKVILEPWGREEGDISRPEIWATSRGPVIDPNDPGSKKAGTSSSSSADADMGTFATAAAASRRKPHNPLMDKITLLVDPSFAETLALVPGLGLGAMWIEIVRLGSGSGAVDERDPGRFWYHEDVTGIFPSFYAPRVKE